MSDESTTQEIVLVPVDEHGRVLLYTDVKIEKVDRDYRTIRGPEGLTWKLTPGEYTVKIFLRNLQMKTVPLTVTPGVWNYRLPVETASASSPADSPVPPPPPQIVEGEIVSVSQKAVPPSPEQVEELQEQKKVSESNERKRFPITFPVSYRTDSGKWVKARALNVSANGLCVENLARVTEDDNLYVKLHVPVATIPIECPARVVWVKSKDSPKPCMGLQLFMTSNMRESLDRWLSGK
ncbi:PilZ domain-containing protein [bacterium]|nr:PilZ domain-containing protein [bacterium]MCI0606781.1 PilZ domain-containing protein [bacterium]